MNAVRIGADARLTYLDDPIEIESLDQDTILRDIIGEADTAPEDTWLRQQHLTDYRHLVVATSSSTGRTIGFVGLSVAATAHESFLLLETAVLVPDVRGSGLMQRMVAMAILRAAGHGPTPQVIATRTVDPNCYRIMKRLASRFGESRFFPEPSETMINLRTATLARRIAKELAPNLRFETCTGTIRGGLAFDRLFVHPDACQCKDAGIVDLFSRRLDTSDQCLIVLDLRSVDEETILEDARRILRGRQQPSSKSRSTNDMPHLPHLAP